MCKVGQAATDNRNVLAMVTNQQKMFTEISWHQGFEPPSGVWFGFTVQNYGPV